MGDLKARIAKRAAQEFHDGDVVNLGIGLPTMCTSFLPEGVDIILQSENGFTGLSGKAEPGKEDYRVIDSGGNWVTYAPYANFFGSEESFSIIRGGHVDATVLGAMQVDQDGNLANWIIPGKAVAGMGGALIKEILASSPLVLESVESLILQPMNEGAALRRWLYENDFYIENEILVKEDGRIYEIILVKRGTRKMPKEIELLLGPVILKHKTELLKERITELKNKEEKKLLGMERSEKAKNSEEYALTENKLKGLEELEW